MTLETIMDPQNEFYVKSEERVRDGPVKVRILNQPADVQVKRVGRASCLEPEIKLCVESDSPVPTTVTVNAYLKVLGSDNKHKHILLKKADPIIFNKVHRKEILGMKLRFLKTIKVQVLKRNLGVSRPEASVVFEAVNELNQVVGSAQTTHFAIISDPRYLDEVKKRRATDRTEDGYESTDSEYGLAKRNPAKRRKICLGMKEPYAPMRENESSFQYNNHNNYINRAIIPSSTLAVNNGMSAPMPSYYSTPPLHSASIRHIINPMISDTAASLSAMKACSDYELSFANSQEEEDTLALLVDSLKYNKLRFPQQQEQSIADAQAR